MTIITSPQNQHLKEIRKLQDKRNRQKTGLFTAEGEDLVLAALGFGWEPVVLACKQSAPAGLLANPAAVVFEDELLDSVSVLASGSRVIGIFEQRWSEPVGRFMLYLHGVSDPGNVGTIIRSSLAFADGPVVLGADCSDPYSPKAIRATMGTIFARPPAKALLHELSGTKVALDHRADRVVEEIGAAVINGVGTSDEDGSANQLILCVGGERDGLSEEIFAECDFSARIEMRPDGPESLNAAVAASIALHAVARVQPAMHTVASGRAGIGISPSSENKV